MPVPADPIAALEARIDAIDDEIARLAEERERIERALAALRGLQDSEPSVNVNSAMQRQARLSHSRAKRKGCDNPLAKAADKAGHTVRSLAERVGCSAALLSQARTGKSSISMDLAKKIEAITGYEATKSNWPELRLGK